MMAHHWITYHGKTRTLAEWARVYHVPADTIRTRLGMGWPIGKALETPSDANAVKAHKKRCKKCKYSMRIGGAQGPVYCDYLCKMWDATGKPHMRPCSAEDCTVFEPRKRGHRKVVDGFGYGRG